MMVKGSTKPIRVFAEMRTVREKTIAIWIGRYNTMREEEWVWLPRSEVRWRYLNPDLRKRCVVTMPEWLADDRGL